MSRQSLHFFSNGMVSCVFGFILSFAHSFSFEDPEQASHTSDTDNCARGAGAGLGAAGVLTREALSDSATGPKGLLVIE